MKTWGQEKKVCYVEVFTIQRLCCVDTYMHDLLGPHKQSSMERFLYDSSSLLQEVPP